MRILEGKIISVKMQNTAVVEITRKTPHPLYKKLIKRRKRYKVDTSNQSLSLGDLVRIVETRPVSKDKHFKVVKVLGAKKPVTLESSKAVKAEKSRKGSKGRLKA